MSLCVVHIVPFKMCQYTQSDNNAQRAHPEYCNEDKAQAGSKVICCVQEILSKQQEHNILLYSEMVFSDCGRVV